MDQALHMQRRLTRSRSRSVIGGVCAGLSEYCGLNLTFIRLLFIVFSPWHGLGFVLYLILFAVMPAQPTASVLALPVLESSAGSRHSLLTWIAGIISFVVGLIGFLASLVGMLDFIIQ